MVGGRGLRPSEPAGEVNMALVPRQTGSALKAFLLTAAYEAGVQTNDTINGVPPCTVPDFVDGRVTTKTVRTGYGELGPFNGALTWRSSDCAFVRLSWAIGLNRVVDHVYQDVADSRTSTRVNPPSEHDPFLPLPLTATGNNAMSALDMAAGWQTIANLGLHHDPYYVDSIDLPDGTRFYTHQDPGVPVISADTASKTLQTLKGVIRSGTGARNLKAFSRPAAGNPAPSTRNNQRMVRRPRRRSRHGRSGWVEPQRLHRDERHPRVRGRDGSAAARCRAPTTRPRRVHGVGLHSLPVLIGPRRAAGGGLRPVCWCPARNVWPN